MFTEAVQAIGRTRVPNYCNCIDSWKADSALIYASLYPPIELSKRSLISKDSPPLDQSKPRMSVVRTANSFAIDIVGSGANVELGAYNVRGDLLRPLWRGSVPAQLAIDVEDLPTGAVIIVMKVPSRGLIQSVKVQ